MLSGANINKKYLFQTPPMFSFPLPRRARLCRAVSHSWCRFFPPQFPFSLFPFCPFSLSFPDSFPSISLPLSHGFPPFLFSWFLAFGGFPVSPSPAVWCLASPIWWHVSHHQGLPPHLRVPVGASLIEHPIQQALVGSNWRPGTHLIPAGLQFQPPNNQPA